MTLLILFAIFTFFVGLKYLNSKGMLLGFTGNTRLLVKKTEIFIKKFLARKDVDILSRRTLAGVVDFAIVSWLYLKHFVVFFVLYAVANVFVSNIYNVRENFIRIFSPIAVMCFLGAWCFFYCIYFVRQEKSQDKATWGKRWIKIEVVTKQNKRLSLRTSTGRALLYLIFFVVTPIYPISQITVFAVVWWVVWLFPAFFTEDNRTLYDILSGTKVVKAKRSRKVDWNFLHGNSWISRFSFGVADGIVGIKNKFNNKRGKKICLEANQNQEWI